MITDFSKFVFEPNFYSCYKNLEEYIYDLKYGEQESTFYYAEVTYHLCNCNRDDSGKLKPSVTIENETYVFFNTFEELFEKFCIDDVPLKDMLDKIMLD